MSLVRHVALSVFPWLFLLSSQPMRGEERDIARALCRLYEARSEEQKEELVEQILSRGRSAREALRRIACRTEGGKAFWALIHVSRKTGDARIPDVLMKRLLDPDDTFLPGYLGAGIVALKGKAVYDELKALTIRSPAKVRARIIRGIGYSGYATAEDPVPTLVSLAEELPAEEREPAYRQAVFVLRHRGVWIDDERERAQFAACLLSWILNAEGSTEGRRKAMGKCPYPPENRPISPPFGIVIREIRGGFVCYSLSDGAVRKVQPDMVKTRLHVRLRRRGNYGVAAFFFREQVSKHTSVAVLFKKREEGWGYGGYIQVSSAIVCYD